MTQNVNVDALKVLRGLESTRLGCPGFRVSGKLQSGIDRGIDNVQRQTFIVECQGDKYRVISVLGEGIRSSAVFDGNNLMVYDGKDSANILDPKNKATVLCFDPRTVSFSTDLSSSLTLVKNLAFHQAEGISIAASKNPDLPKDLVTISFTDRFGQKITFDMQPNPPYRVYRYSKLVPGEITFEYSAESEFRDRDPAEWFPSRIVFLTASNVAPDRKVLRAVEFGEREMVDEFPPGNWSYFGLNLQIGAAISDLRIKQRIGHWNGIEVVPENN